VKIAVVGATGPTGKLVVAEALNRGHAVVAYVRNAEKLQAHENLLIATGQLANIDSFSAAIRDCDVIISCLGTRSRKEFTFARTNLPFVSNAMKKAGVSRLVLMSSFGAGTIAKGGLFSRALYWVIAHTLFNDRTKSEIALNESGITWTGVYPPFLIDGPAAPEVDIREMHTVKGMKGNGKVARINVAKFLVDCAEDQSTAGKRFAICSSGVLI
jgi:putative NADH-flavin reductase